MELSTNVAGLTLTEDDDTSGAAVYAAKAAGYKFIEVHLNPNANVQNAGRITGAYKLNVYPAGTDRNNLPKYDFHVRGGDIEFAFDKRKYVMLAQVLDDTEKGAVSDIGYNRDLLATHIDMFIIPDKDVEKDVLKRAERIRERAFQKKPVDGTDMTLYGEETITDIDKKIQELTEKKAKMASSTEPAPTKNGKKSWTEEERNAVRERLMSARARKKAEREAEASSGKEEQVAKHETDSEVAPA